MEIEFLPDGGLPSPGPAHLPNPLWVTHALLPCLASGPAYPRGARFLEKVIKSAMANAEDKGARNVEGLKITEARVDGGPMFKRIQPRARGMAYTIRRRMAHIHVAIEAPELP